MLDSVTLGPKNHCFHLESLKVTLFISFRCCLKRPNLRHCTKHQWPINLFNVQNPVIPIPFCCYTLFRIHREFEQTDDICVSWLVETDETATFAVYMYILCESSAESGISVYKSMPYFSVLILLKCETKGCHADSFNPFQNAIIPNVQTFWCVKIHKNLSPRGGLRWCRRLGRTSCGADKQACVIPRPSFTKPPPPPSCLLQRSPTWRKPWRPPSWELSRWGLW